MNPLRIALTKGRLEKKDGRAFFKNGSRLYRSY